MRIYPNDEIIEHLKKMQGQAEENLEKDEIGTWHRGFYSGEMRAYKHCTEYLQRHLTSAMHSDGEGRQSVCFFGQRVKEAINIIKGYLCRR